MSTQTVARTCNLCEAMCGLLIDVESSLDANTITRIEGNPGAPLSKGYICPKASALQDLYDDPDRLRQPMRRIGDTWEPISWDEAFAEASRRIADVQKTHGRNSIGVYFGNPTAHNLGSMIFLAPFVSALGSKNRFSASSLDQWPSMFAAYFMYGHQLLIPMPDWERTDYVLMLGANPMISNGSLMATPNFRDTARALRDRGGKLVVVDPRRTRTAEEASEHVCIRPGTDVAFLLSLLHEIHKHGFQLGPHAAYARRLDELVRVAREFSPESTEAATGISPLVVRSIAHELVSRPHAAVYGRLGVSTQEFGGLCAWLIQVLNLVTGNLDETGGSLFASPAVNIYTDVPGMGMGRGSYNRWTSRVRGLAEFGGELPTAVLAEEIATPGVDQVRGLVTIAGNPVLSSPNGRKLDSALAGLECYVAIDYYINESTRHAHLILPPVSPVERSHYDVVLALFGSRNFAVYSPPLFPRSNDTYDDGEILAELSVRLLEHKFGSTHRRTLAARAQRALGADRLLDLALRAGPYGRVSIATQAMFARRPSQMFARGLSVRALRQRPEGIDLGARKPVLPHALPSSRRYIDAAPAHFLNDIPRAKAMIEAWNTNTAPNVPAEMLLVGRRELRSNNSWMHNSPRLMRGRDRCSLMIHHDDASALGVHAGDTVRVSTRTGAIEVHAELTDEVMRGVVSLPHGYGHARSGVQLNIATRQPGVSINDITDELRLDAATGNAAWFGTPVRVERVTLASNGELASSAS